MLRRRLPALAAAVAALLVAPAAGAQDGEEPPVGGFVSGEAAAFLALTLTPVGALAPSHDWLLRPRGEPPAGMRLHGRFGTIDRGTGISQRTAAATLDVPVGAASLGLTAGYLDIGCDEDELSGGFDIALSCKGGLVLDARLARGLAARPLDAQGASTLVLGIEGTVGYADIALVELEVFDTTIDADAQALSASIGLPLALVARSGTTTIAPFVTPRVGWGRAEVGFGDGSDDAAESGVRAMLGAGVAVRFGPSVGLDLGLQRVFAEDAETAFGFGVSLRF